MAKVKTITFVRELGAEDKIAPQMRNIVESAIETHGTDVAIEVADVVKSMEGNIETRQPLERVLGYYLPKLEAAELVTVERTESAPRKAKVKADSEPVDGELEDETADEEV